MFCGLMIILIKLSLSELTHQQYVSRDNSKAVSGKDKSTYILVKRDDQQLSDKSVILTSASGTAALEEETGMALLDS